MDAWQAVVYGVIQGATEYLPVSSSAHLALAPFLLGWDQPSLAFDILVQLGTLGAVMVYLRDDLVKIVRAMVAGMIARRPFDDPWAKKGWLLGVATIPAVVFGLAIKDFVEEALGDPRQVLLELLITGLLLIGAELIARRRAGQAGHPVTTGRATLIGFAQALAILPGVSRSGATIAGALAVGVEREEAGRFSFLLSIPVMLGAGALGLKDLADKPELIDSEGAGILISFATAALVGFVVIRWFLGYIRRHSLYGFGVYCIAVALVGLLATRL
ncbi:MAG: undecaprenyl-diphosphatase UppP [Deltaproteobacteria bacterium RBG_16_71_12]|nr:MAG: undecaprenyl-diphosphatase UppP [Deltaproteobacteria bacterium RBG_16_71_12]